MDKKSCQLLFLSPRSDTLVLISRQMARTTALYQREELFS
ncbi:hypothetical protein DJ66_0430 [Candidatus Liberibacter solanacearum]|uniref:Uncharacterized protein n=1 Tax=Candidatus Liberibacter solanacearum TaxID=556287 RepID=A0A0F4VJN8_9HYPH|nr:hypothetical protein DJ66_0430 [Candidatus Liberibacter solanacearum]